MSNISQYNLLYFAGSNNLQCYIFIFRGNTRERLSLSRVRKQMLWKQQIEPTNKIINKWEALSKMEAWCTYQSPLTGVYLYQLLMREMAKSEAKTRCVMYVHIFDNVTRQINHKL